MSESGTSKNYLGIAALFAICVIAALAVWQRWQRGPAVLRPDTGEMATKLGEADLRPVLVELLRQIYSAFGEEEEFAIYDGLAGAVDSDLLTDLYLQRRAAQEQEFSSGGSTEITSVELTDMTPLESDGPDYVIDARWNVVGLVTHTEHQHERFNTYSAVVTLGPADGIWKLTRFDLNSIDREEVEPLFFEDFE